MTSDRGRQTVLVVSLLAIGWLGAMGVHELGHVVAAQATGARVTRVVWHPAALSRTDVAENASPGVVVWAGPIVGVVLPLVIAGVGSAMRLRWAYLVWFFAGACLIVNGAYIGIGSFDGVGDTGVMLRSGSPRWALIVFGLATAPVGLYIWHRVSDRLGFGREPRAIDPVHTRAAAMVAGVMIVLLFVFGDAG